MAVKHIGATFSLNIKSLTESTKSIISGVNNIKTQFTTVRSATDSYTAGMNSSGTATDSFRAKLQSLSAGSLGNLNAEVERYKSSLAQAKADVEGHKAALQNVKAEYKSASTEVLKIKQEQKQLNQSVKEQETVSQKVKQQQEEINKKLQKAKEYQEQVKVKVSESAAALENSKAKVSQIQTEYGKFNSKVEKSKSALSGVKDSLGGIVGKVVGIAAAYVSVSAIKKFGQECVTASNNAVASHTRLNTIMEQIPGNTDAMTESVRQYASELSKSTTIGGSAQRNGASQLASFQMSAESIKKLMPQLNNLAVANNGITVSSDQMIAAANMIGKAYSGQTSAMTRAGVVMSDEQANLIKTGDEATKTATLVEVLRQNFGDLAENMAKTPEGRVQQLRNAWGGVKATVGEKVYPAITQVLEYVTDRLPGIQSAFSGIMDKVSPGLLWVTSTALPAVGNGIGTVIDSVKEIYTACKPSLDNVKEGFVKVKDAIFGVFDGSTLDLITDLAKTALPVVCDGIAGVLDIVSKIIPAIKPLTPVIMGVIGGIMSFKGMSGVIGIIGKIPSVLAGVGAAIGALTSPIGLVSVGIGAAIAIGVALYKNWDTIKEKAGQCWEAVKNFFAPIGDFFKEKWEAVKNVTGAALDAVKGYVSPKLNAIKTAYEEHGGGIKGVAAGAMEGIKQYYSIGYDALNTLTGGKLGEVVSAAKAKFDELKQKCSEAWDSVKEKTGAVLDTVKGYVSPKLEEIKSAYEEHGGGLKGVAAGAMEGVKQYYSMGYDAINAMTGGKLGEIAAASQTGFELIKGIGINAFSEMQTAYTEHGGGIKGVFSAIISGAHSIWEQGFGLINTVTDGKAGEILNTVTSKFEAIKDKIKGAMETAKDTVRNAIDTIKGFFNFSWELPKLKLPHFKIDGDFSLYPPSVPTFDVEWYAKGGILNRPTIFGMNGSSAMVGGEAGAEAVLPLDMFWAKLEQAIKSSKRESGGDYYDQRKIDIHVDARDKTADEVVGEIITPLKIAITNM